MADDTIPEWMDNLPEELKDASQLKTVPDIETLAKNYVEQDKVLNGSIRLPKDDEESQKKFKDRLDTLGFAPKEGVPESYELPDAGDEDWAKDFTDGRMEYYKALGLTQKQAEKAMEKDLEGLNSYRDDLSATTKALKDQYGAELESLVANAQKAVEKYGLEDIAKSPFGATKQWNELMIEIGKEFQEDGPTEGGAPTGESREELLVQEKEMKAELSRLYREGLMTEGSPEAAAWTTKYNQLMARKAGLKPGDSLGAEFVKNNLSR